MSKRQLIIILGVWIMVFLFLGFPSAWDKVFALVTGFLLCLVAFKLERSPRGGTKMQVPFVEHKHGNVAATSTAPSVPSPGAPVPIINSDTTATS